MIRGMPPVSRAGSAHYWISPFSSWLTEAIDRGEGRCHQDPDEFMACILFQCPAPPGEVARSVVFMASVAASRMTGAARVVDRRPLRLPARPGRSGCTGPCPMSTAVATSANICVLGCGFILPDPLEPVVKRISRTEITPCWHDAAPAGLQVWKLLA
ncbi:hypothetical protein GCM10010275_43290 [Streptomyces litmocidini]|nr:hypothetical protein GCM10010275_43290 [Streptomyces litmocidini]